MFSVVIPLYNKELSVHNTIQSVLNQSYSDVEILVVNDGSTDSSVEKVKEIKDSRICIINKPNGGVSSARNKGIEEAKYEWIVFLDGDDLWEKNHLEVLKEMIWKYPQDKVFCTSFIKSNQRIPTQIDNTIVVIENYFKEVINHNFFWTSVTCLHKSVFEKVGVFDTRLSRGEDMELWTRVGREYRFIKSNTITAVYRIDAENRSNLTFDLNRSRIYHYDFSTSASLEETLYYKDQIIKRLRSFIINRRFNDFIRLIQKHSKQIKFLDLFKR